MLAYILGVCEWTFGRDWERSKFAKKRRMPELPVERGGERIKKENKTESETKGEMNDTTAAAYCTSLTLPRAQCTHLAHSPQVKLTCMDEESSYHWVYRFNLPHLSWNWTLPRCSTRSNKQTNNSAAAAAAAATGWRSCSVSAYLHLLCRISSNLYSRHRQADRHQPTKYASRTDQIVGNGGCHCCSFSCIIDNNGNKDGKKWLIFVVIGGFYMHSTALEIFLPT